MTENLTNLILFLVEEAYSSTASAICEFLIENGEATLMEIVKTTKKEFTVVRDCLIVLIQNKLVKPILTKKKEVFDYNYIVDKENCLNIIRHPKYLVYVNTHFGKLCKNIVEEMLVNGVMTCSQVIELIENKTDISSVTFLNQIRKDFLNLVVNNILVQVENINGDDKFNEMLYSKENDYMVLMGVNKDKYNGKDNNDKDAQEINKNSMILNNKMQATGKKGSKTNKKKVIQYEEYENNNFTSLEKNVEIVNEDHNLLYNKDNNKHIFYIINYEKLNQLLKCEMIFEAIAKKFSIQTAQVAQLFIANASFIKGKLVTSPITIKELIANISESNNSSKSVININSLKHIIANPQLVEEIIKESKSDDSGIFKYYGLNDLGKELIYLNLESLFFSMKTKLKEKVVEQLLSPIHARVFRLLDKCGPLDLKNIMDICMIPQKECCICLNQLVKMSFLEIQELNIKGSNQIFFKPVKDSKELSIISMIYKIILNLKNLVKKKVSENQFSMNELTKIQVAKVLSTVAELDKFLVIFN